MLSHALSRIRSNIIPHEQIIILDLLATSNGIRPGFVLGFGFRRATVTLKLKFWTAPSPAPPRSTGVDGAVYNAAVLLLVRPSERSALQC